MENEVRYLYLDDIIPNRFQPRENFDEQALKELAVSIREHGVIQPIVVRQIGEKYEIIAGERRYKASTLAGLTKIPAIVRNLDDKESSKVALIENLQRRDLTPIEEARTYQKILELDALTQEELAKTMGKSQSAVCNKLRLLSLTDEVQDALLHEQISERHARSLLNVENPVKQIELLNKVITSRMTVRELDEEIKKLNNANINNNNGSIDPIYNSASSNNYSFDINSFLNTSPVAAKEPIETQEKFTANYNVNNAQNYNNDNNILPNEDNAIEQMPELEEIVGDNSLFTNSKPNIENNISKEPVDTIQIDDNVYSNFRNNINQEQSQIYNDIQSINIPQTKPNIPTDSIQDVRSVVEKIKSTGKNVDIDEMDFDDFYQIVIRINK